MNKNYDNKTITTPSSRGGCVIKCFSDIVLSVKKSCAGRLAMLRLIKTCVDDAKAYFCFSLMSGYDNTQRSFLGMITLQAHVIEKGIVMPNRHLPFGQDKVKALVGLCNEYADKGYDTADTAYIAALSVIMEYRMLHEENNVPITENLAKEIEALKKRFPETTVEPQPVVERQSMFRRGDFKYVAEHRHSVRNFVGKVNEEDLKKAIELAQTAPSACNRQPVSVYIVNNTHQKGDLFEKITTLQRGCRGFGQNADKLLIVAVSRETYTGSAERNLSYVDGGIYTMNMLYALQYYGIASCTLAGTLLPKDFCSVYLDEKEVVCALIAIGYCPDKLSVARSHRTSPRVKVLNER